MHEMSLCSPILPNRSPFLVSANRVEQNLESLIVFDGTFVLPNAEVNATQAYLAWHIPGAQRFDVDVVKDIENPLPHMLPKPAQMTQYLRDLGVHEDSAIVIYDQQGLFGAARVWWMLRAYGLKNVFILDGGLPRWLQENRPTESGNVLRMPSAIDVSLNPKLVSNKQDVKAALDDKDIQIVDARAVARFRGDQPEPRAGLRAGHMPGAINLPYDNFIENGSLKNLDELRAILAKAGIELEKKIISTCGSGVSAAMLCLVLASLGYDDWSLYDGSWAEWGACAECMIESAA